MLPVDLRAPLTSARARELGIDAAATKRLVRAGAGVLLSDGRIEVRADVDEERLARLGLGENVVVCMESAAARYGWPVTAQVLHLSLPRSRSRARWPGADVSTRRGECDKQVVDGACVTSPETTIIDLACWRGLRPALRCLDAALHRKQTYPRRMRRALAARVRSPGIRTAQLALALSSELRQSPLESDFRVLIHEAGLPAPVDQYVVRSGGNRVGRADFTWPEAMVVVELDGYEFHRERTPFEEDRRRDRRMRLDGWLVLRFTASDLELFPALVVEQVRAALADRGLAV